MTQAAKIAIPLAVCAALGAGAYFFLNRPDPVAPAPIDPPSPAVVQPAVDEPPPKPAQAGGIQEQKPVAEPDRTAATTPIGEAWADAPQGVRGRVLLPGGAPAAEVPVYLLESSMNDPIKVFLANKSGARTLPAAATVTAADGSFALGVRTPGKTYDLRIVDEEHPEKSLQGIKVREEDWFSTGDVMLDVGIVVQGRVVEEITNAPVAGAMVFLTGSNQAHTLVATPGRERGIQAETDATGFFRFGNAPRQGPVNLSVEAPGYASSPLLNHPVKEDALNEITIEVSRGRPIAGVAVDVDGKPVAGIAITATGLSAKTPQTAQANSGSDGAFQFPSLREGPYQLLATSPQYGDLKLQPVLAGDTEVKLVLQQRAFAKLRVRGASGQPIKAYRLSLKRHFPNNPLGIGNVPEFADRRITPADYSSEFGGEWAVIRGLPSGEYVFQIQDNDHAKTLSPPFTVAEGGPAPEVDAVLTMGGVITGTVIDDRGTPVAGATVTTDMNGGFAADGGFFEIFRSFIPEKHSKMQVKTDGQGRFRIAKLAFADYMVRVHHPSYCEGTAIDISLASEGQVVDAGVVQLSRGAIIEGTTTVVGVPTGQVKVTVTVPPPQQVQEVPSSTPPKAQAMFSATAISDGNGGYRLLKRVPPGTYKVHASRQAGDQNPFNMLLDMKKTEQTIMVAPGQDVIVVNFDLERR